MNRHTTTPPVGRLLTERQVAETAGISVRTLQAWRTRNYGPKVAKLGRSVRYPERDLRIWLAARSGGPGQAGAGDEALLGMIAGWKAATDAFDRDCIGIRPGMETVRLADRCLTPAHAAIADAPVATTADGALAALRMAANDLEATLCSDVAAAMVRSATAFLETLIPEQCS